MKLSEFEIDSLGTPLMVARENALWELRRARLYNHPPVVEWCQARVEALDKVIEALAPPKERPYAHLGEAKKA